MWFGAASVRCPGLIVGGWLLIGDARSVPRLKVDGGAGTWEWDNVDSGCGVSRFCPVLGKVELTLSQKDFVTWTGYGYRYQSVANQGWHGDSGALVTVFCCSR